MAIEDDVLEMLGTSQGRSRVGLEEAISGLNPADFSRGFEQAQELDPEAQEASNRALGYGASEQRKLLGRAKNTAKDIAAMGGDPTSLRQAISEARKPREISDEKGWLQRGLEVLDAPQHAVRAVTMPGGGWFDWGATSNSKDWHRALDRAAKKGDLGAQLVTGARDVAGFVGGQAIGPWLAAPGFAVDVLSGKTKGAGKRVQKTVESTKRDVGEFALETATDPLNFIPVGKMAGAIGKTAARGAEKIPAFKRLAEAALGVGEKGILGGLEARAELKSLARQARGQKDIALERLLGEASAGPKQLELGAVPKLGPFETPDIAKQTIETANRTANAEAKQWFTEAAGKALGVENADQLPREARAIIEATFDSKAESFSSWLKSTNHPAAAQIAKLYEVGVGALRENVLSRRPGYHWTNIANDSVQMFLGGMNDPRRLVEARRLLLGGKGSVKTAKYGEISADGLRRVMTEQGLLGGGLERLGFLPDYARQMVAKRMAKPSWSDVSKGGKAVELVTGKALERTPLGRLGFGSQTGENWEQIAKGAMFIDQLHKGKSFSEAAKHTVDFLLDYRDAGSVLQKARWVMPFVSWMAKAPGMAGKALVQRPGRVAATIRLPQKLGGEEKIEPREARVEVGQNVPLTVRGEQVVGDISRLMGGTGLRQGQTYLRTRNPVPEALAPYLRMLEKGDVRPLVEQLGPGPQAAIAALGMNPQTGAELGESGLAAGAKYFAGTALPSMAASIPMQELYNLAASEAMGGAKAGAPAKPLSYYASPSMDTGADRARSILASIFGASTFTARPQDRPLEKLEQVRGKIEKAAIDTRSARNKKEANKAARKRSGEWLEEF